MNRKVLLPDPERFNPPPQDEALPTLELSDAEVDALVSTIAPRVQRENERINKELTLLAERTQVATNASGAVIALLSAEALVCRGRSGPAVPPRGTKLDRNAGLAGECVRTGGILLCDDCETDERVDAATFRVEGTHSILVVPLYHNGEVIGVFEVFSPTQQAFGYEDIAVLQTMAEMAVNAVYPQRTQPPPTAEGKGSTSKAEIIAGGSAIPSVPSQDIGIDLSKLVVEPEEMARDSRTAEDLPGQRPPALPKRPLREELAPIHDPEDDLVCELGPEKIADLLQTAELEDPELALFHPAQEHGMKRPVVSRKLIIMAAAVVVLALIWLKFCGRATAVPQEQTRGPAVRVPAEASSPFCSGLPGRTITKSRITTAAQEATNLPYKVPAIHKRPYASNCGGGWVEWDRHVEGAIWANAMVIR